MKNNNKGFAMKKTFYTLIAGVAALATVGCGGNAAQPANEPADAPAEVLLTTTAGPIRIQLSDLTPLHRDNFLKLTREGYFDSVLFHRVIADFMIQTGDPDSKQASDRSQPLGMGGPDYTVPAEFRFPQLAHVRGAVAAARTGDHMNPQRASSGSQFYIVWGSQFDAAMLSMMQAQNPTIDWPDSLRRLYATVGGTPHLDGAYTVFGQVVEGLEVVEAIQGVATDNYDRPIEDVRIIRAEVIEPQPAE